MLFSIRYRENIGNIFLVDIYFREVISFDIMATARYNNIRFFSNLLFSLNFSGNRQLYLDFALRNVYIFRVHLWCAFLVFNLGVHT